MSGIFYNMCTIFCVILSTVIIPGNGVVLDCYNTSIREYDGHQQTTVTGKACLRWDQFNEYFASYFTDATISDAANFCRSTLGYGGAWCFTSISRTLDNCGINKCGDDGLRECGKLNIDKPTILGRNVTFSFTPDTYNPHAILEWQRSMNGVNQWKTLPLNYKFTQYERNMTYYLILTDSVRNNDEGFYRIHYYNETIHCWMDAGKLTLEEPPSVPVIVGLQDIENCKDCIVGEHNEKFKLACEIHGGSRPLTVTMTIGNESYKPLEWSSTTYNVYFILKDHHHMKHVVFSVMNHALSSPLSVTARMYVIKPPTFQFSMPEILRDGEDNNITCMLDGGRPNPGVYFIISGSELSSANSHFYNSTSSLHTNVITLTTFKKEWNKENITCCRYNKWYKIARECSSPKQVNYMFPPSNVLLEVKVDEGRITKAYAVCIIYSSNPVCNVQFRAAIGIIGSKRSSSNISLPHGAWSSVLEVNLNVSVEDNGKDVTCVAECDQFTVDLKNTVKILLHADLDGRETGDDMSITGKIETCVGLGSIVGSVIAVLAVGILIGVICTFFILTRKGNLKDSKKQQTPHPTMSQDIELTGPSSTLDTYEQLQNRTGTENRETYDSLEDNLSMRV
ncbi:uncharacterized protein LOC132714368 isoform X2 [Ruditapes philippinarum]|uniref:uncharacterized protein LOC132714368 isoform X2 n=1 Tax=Ruditapes philippinarum TaxID=129788 RepID=UPI00295A982B|nr:uncharacterized protein LOC132714368 isoform X2 [Ruditapes philippinarum]